MRTELDQRWLDVPEGRRADAILRRCVHCGLCNAVCPTYQLLGDELDGPRGRIYLIKNLLETPQPDLAGATRKHLDACLTCRACETVCPSGVDYGELLETGRLAAGAAGRSAGQRVLRWLLGLLAPRARRMSALVRPLRWFLWLLPSAWAAPLRVRPALSPMPQAARQLPASGAPGAGRALLLQGCVQAALTPQATAAAGRYLEAHGVEVCYLPNEHCCGGLNLHLNQTGSAHAWMRRNLDALAPRLSGLRWIISSASGCGVTVKDLGRLFANDPHYGPIARAVSAKTRDLAEVATELEAGLAPADGGRPVQRTEAEPIQPPAIRSSAATPDRGLRVAWQAPCTLQHGQRLTGLVEPLLARAGYAVQSLADAHMCCGSAGVYSLLQPDMAADLKQAKLTQIRATAPDLVATANVGCQLHLSGEPGLPVCHWIELLDPARLRSDVPAQAP